jgi:1-phosphatidylinositol phosphodiesterase
MLNAGIRVFDFICAFDPTNSTLVFWHTAGLQSETAIVEDVLFGFYKWLDDHPSETLRLSLQYECLTTVYAQNDAATQMEIFNTLTSPVAKKHFPQTKNEFGTLGEARGKIILLSRFDLDQLPASYTDALPGVYSSSLAPWTGNGSDIALA